MKGGTLVGYVLVAGAAGMCKNRGKGNWLQDIRYQGLLRLMYGNPAFSYYNTWSKGIERRGIGGWTQRRVAASNDF
jgi:hypothetical protein